MIDRRHLLATALAGAALSGGEALGAVQPTTALWTTIAAARQQAASDDEALVEAVTARLTAGGANLALAFEEGFNEAMQQAYRWNLWGAGYVIHGGMSDDGFDYFRAWLIGQGRAAFDQALADPDSLGDLIPADREAALEMESLLYAAAGAWEEVTGHSADGPQWQSSATAGGNPAGEPFKEETLAQTYPRLTARFADAPLA